MAAFRLSLRLALFASATAIDHSCTLETGCPGQEGVSDLDAEHMKTSLLQLHGGGKKVAAAKDLVELQKRNAIAAMVDLDEEDGGAKDVRVSLQRKLPTAIAPELFYLKIITHTADVVCADGTETEDGDCTTLVEVHREWGPKQVDRLHRLATEGYWDDTRIYRMLHNWAAQWGPSGIPETAQKYDPTTCTDPAACIFNGEVKKKNLVGYLVFSSEGAADTCAKNPNAIIDGDPKACQTHTADELDNLLVDASELFINLGKNDDVLDDMGFNPIGQVIRGFDNVLNWYAGYGEMHGGSLGDALCDRQFAYDRYPDAPCSGPNPDMLYSSDGGNAYFDKEFPLMTKILKMEITMETPKQAP